MTFKEDMERMMGIRKGTIRPWEEGMKRALNMESEPVTRSVKEAVSKPIRKADGEDGFKSYARWKRQFLKDLAQRAVDQGQAPPDYLRGAFQGYIRPALLNTYIDRNGNIGQERPKERDETVASRAPQSESGLKWYNFPHMPGKFYLKKDGTQTASVYDLMEEDLDPRTGLGVPADVPYILSSKDKENIIAGRHQDAYNRGLEDILNTSQQGRFRYVFNDIYDAFRTLQKTNPNASVAELDEMMDETIRMDAPMEMRIAWGLMKNRLPNDVTRMLGEDAYGLYDRFKDDFENRDLVSSMYDMIHRKDADRHEEWKGEELRNKELASQLAEHMVTRALAGDAPAFLSPKVQRSYIGEDGQEYSNYPVTRMIDDAFDHAQKMVRSLYYDEKGNLKVDEDGTPLFETMTPEQVVSGYQKLLNRKEGQLNRAKTMDRRQNEQRISEMMADVDEDVDRELLKHFTKKIENKIAQKIKKAEEEGGTFDPKTFWDALEAKYPGSVDKSTGMRLAHLTTRMLEDWDKEGKYRNKFKQDRIDQIQNSMRLDPDRDDRGWNPMKGAEQGQSALGNYLANLSDEQLAGFFDSWRSGDSDVTGMLSRLGLDGVPDDDEVTSPKLMEALERADQLSKVSAWESQQADRDLRRRMELSGVKTSDNVPSWEEMYDEEFLNGLNSPIERYQREIFSAVPELRAKLSESLVEQAKADGTFNPKKPPKAGLGEVLANLSPEDAGKLDKANSFLQGISTGSNLPLIVKNAQGVDILNPDLLDKYRAQSKIREDRVNFDPANVKNKQEKSLKDILAYFKGDSDALRGKTPKKISGDMLSFLHPDYHAAINQYNALVDTWVDDSKDGEDDKSIKLIGDPYHGANPFMEKIPERDIDKAYGMSRYKKVPFKPDAQNEAYLLGLNEGKEPLNDKDLIWYGKTPMYKNNLYDLANAAYNMGGRRFFESGAETYDHYMSKVDPEYKALEDTMRADRMEIDKARARKDKELMATLEAKMAENKKKHDDIILGAKKLFEDDQAPLRDIRNQVRGNRGLMGTALGSLANQIGIKDHPNFLINTLNKRFNTADPKISDYDPPKERPNVDPLTEFNKAQENPAPAPAKTPDASPGPNVSNVSQELKEIEKLGYDTTLKKSAMPTLREMMGMFAVQKEGHPYGQPMFGDIAPLPGEKPLQGDDAEKE